MARVFPLWRPFADLVREWRLRIRARRQILPLENHTAGSDFPSRVKFSKLDWPHTEYVRSARRARGALLRQLVLSLIAIPKRADRSEGDAAARYEGQKWCDSSERRLNDELAILHHGQSRSLPFQRDDGTDEH